MRWNVRIAVAAAGVLIAVPAFAQQIERAPQVAPEGSTRILSGAVETRITTGRPYSAEAVTENVQVLADGNRISRTSVTKIWRDSAGRTRRESYRDGTSPQTIAISDPVAHTSYTLNPEKRIAYQTSATVLMPKVAAATGPGGRVTAAPARGEGGVTLPRTQAPVQAPAVLPLGHPEGGLLRSKEPENVKREDLGVQNIEGVLARGTRTTTVIPAGEIGNAQEIQIVSERWFSEELEVLVMTRHSDPRTGEVTYRLRNIVRAEPDPSLFTVPSDYTVRERGIRRPE